MSHYLNRERTDQYLAAAPEGSIRNTLKELIDKTIYVPESTFKAYLNAAFDLFEKAIGDKPFWLYLPQDSTKQWIASLLQERIEKLNYQRQIFRIPTDRRIDILYITDLFDQITEDYIHPHFVKEKLGYTAQDVKRIHIVLPFLDENSEYSLSEASVYSATNLGMAPFVEALIENENFADAGIMLEDDITVYFDHARHNSFDKVWFEGVIPTVGAFGSLGSTPPEVKTPKW